MKNVATKTLTAAQIRALNLSKDTRLGYDYNSGHYLLLADGKVIALFSNGRDRKNTKSKIQRMGLGWGWTAPIITDEDKGIIQAAKNGENPFAYTIMCANPALNEIVK